MRPNLPIYVADLASVPEPYAIAYLREGNGYRLSDAIATVVDEGEAELARIKAEGEARIASLEGQIADMAAKRKRQTVRSALSHALTEAGVSEGLAAGAAALIEATENVEVEDNGFGPVVLGHTKLGLKSAERLALDFLASDDGAPFRPRRSAPSDGYFADMVRQMQERR